MAIKMKAIPLSEMKDRKCPKQIVLEVTPKFFHLFDYGFYIDQTKCNYEA